MKCFYVLLNQEDKIYDFNPQFIFMYSKRTLLIHIQQNTKVYLKHLLICFFITLSLFHKSEISYLEIHLMKETENKPHLKISRSSCVMSKCIQRKIFFWKSENVELSFLVFSSSLHEKNMHIIISKTYFIWNNPFYTMQCTKVYILQPKYSLNT